MQADNRMFDDFVKFVNGAAGTFAGMAREGQADARAKFKEWIGGQDFVGREEFDAVKTMAAAARDEVDALRARLDALEGAAPPAVVKPGKPGAARRKAPPKGKAAPKA